MRLLIDQHRLEWQPAWQISNAGMEASGTGNMKLALNGALTIGTMDGANIEMREQIGPGNMFIFGLTAEQVAEQHRQGYRADAIYQMDEALRRALDMVGNGFFSPEDPGRYRPIVDSLLGPGGDRFMVPADFRAYLECSRETGRVFADREEWTRRAIRNTAATGVFSSDRTVREYATRIWGSQPVRPRATPRDPAHQALRQPNSPGQAPEN